MDSVSTGSQTLKKDSKFVEGPVTARADRLLLVGAVLLGTCVLSPIGLAIVILALFQLRQAVKQGESSRPLSVTIIGVFALVDACFYFLGWGLSYGTSSTFVMQYFANGFGRLVDGGYYVGYNTTWIGASGASGENAWGLLCVLAIFPARVVAAWGFLKMKRWGYHFTIITTWAYMAAWLGYLINISPDFDTRFATTEFGIYGWWFFNIWYATAFVMIPWLYMLNPKRWNR